MLFKITPTKDELLEKIYKDSMKSLNEFYELNWVHHLPTITIVDDRATIDTIRGEKTQPWMIGWSNSSRIYILNRDNFEKESSHKKYEPEKYAAFIKHELSHCFYHILAGYSRFPAWLDEGTAIYTSGQNRFKKKPEKFGTFLEFYEHGAEGVYAESGFFVQILVEKFGKQKLLELIKGLKSIKTKEEFERFFAKHYGFPLDYEEINSRNL